MLEIIRMPSTPDTATGNSGLLPARMDPLPDELLSSWLVRLAMAHGMKLHSFCVEIFGEKAQIWNRDIDKSADERVLNKLSEKTGVNYEKIFQTTLANYAGKIYETHNPNGNTVWIMPLKIYHRQRLRYGLQYCPYCLLEDVDPYYRREWRLSWIILCDKHEIVLFDRCPGCNNPVIFYRHEMGHKNQPIGYSMIECSFCEAIWTANKWLSKCVKADSAVTRFQTNLKRIVADGWGEFSEFGYVHSILYFKGLKQILRVLSTCNRSISFRQEIFRRSRINLEIDVSEMNFDFLATEKRYTVLQAVAWLTKDFPTQFIEVADKSETWASVLLPYDLIAPFWYWKIVTDNLSRKALGPSEAEIRSALSILEKRHRKLNIPILTTHLQDLMQRKTIFRKTSREFRGKIYERMKLYNQSKFLNLF